jgi:hypothetical protein
MNSPIPSGRVSLEHVVEYLLREWNVASPREQQDWERVLHRSPEQFEHVFQ